MSRRGLRREDGAESGIGNGRRNDSSVGTLGPELDQAPPMGLAGTLLLTAAFVVLAEGAPVQRATAALQLTSQGPEVSPARAPPPCPVAAARPRHSAQLSRHTPGRPWLRPLRPRPPPHCAGPDGRCAHGSIPPTSRGGEASVAEATGRPRLCRPMATEGARSSTANTGGAGPFALGPTPPSLMARSLPSAATSCSCWLLAAAANSQWTSPPGPTAGRPCKASGRTAGTDALQPRWLPPISLPGHLRPGR